MLLVGTLTAVNVTGVAFTVNFADSYGKGGGSSVGSPVQCIRAPCEFPPTSSSNAGGNNDMKCSPSSLSSTSSLPHILTTTTTNDSSSTQ